MSASSAGTSSSGGGAVSPPLDAWERRFLVVVALFTSYVVFWGVLFPQGLGRDVPGFAKDVSHALPFDLVIPPLHARFVGALYLAATVILLLALRRGQTWADQRACVWMILAWTAMLELISLLRPDLFAWDRRPIRPLVAWWLAYTWFPVHAAWILWRRRDAPWRGVGGTVDGGGAGLAGWKPDAPVLRLTLRALAVLCLAVAAVLFFAPGLGAALWPWKLPVVLAMVYSGPFVALGVGALVAAGGAGWRARDGFVLSTLLFLAVTLLASLRHRTLFDVHRPATWIWFGGLGLALAALLVWGVLPARRSAA